jgi:hypothetical protein
VLFASGQLQGEAQDWWESYEYGRPAYAPAVTWQEFRENFRAYHIPEGMIELKAEEFRNLTQGSLSVAEYRERFAQLSRYAPHEVANDSDKQHRFLKGLYDGLQLQLMSNTYPNFQTLVNRAIVVITSTRRWMPRGKGFRDRPPVVTLIRVLVSSKVINRGLLLVSGIMVRSLSAISSRNVPHSSRRMTTNALRSRVGIRLSVRALPIILS